MSANKRRFTAAELNSQHEYRVIAAFTDYEGILHPVGETWRFVGKNFLPYEDGLTLFVEQNGQSRWLQLQWREETQGHIIDQFSDYVEEG